MTKILRDYLHLYLKGQTKFRIVTAATAMLRERGWFLAMDISLTRATIFDAAMNHENIKLILRSLDDITQAETVSLIELRSDVYKKVHLEKSLCGNIQFSFEYETSSRRRSETQSADELSPQQFMFLLLNRFDLFKLIESELAIDEKIITTK